MSQFRLINDEYGLALLDSSSRQKPLRIDFASAALNYRRGPGSSSGKEGLAKSTGAREGLRVIDCTAGLGRDAFMLASFGCEVTLVERSPVLIELLRDAFGRAAGSEVTEIVGRMRLVEADAIDFLRHLDEIPDVIYLDPMFPPRNKQAKVKGDMQMLQRLIGPDPDIDALIRAARDTKCSRTVLKRPAHGASDTGLVPDYTIKGRTSRFDVFLQ